MQFTPNVDVAKWLDNTRGILSRQALITAILRKEMALTQETSSTKEINEQTRIIYGASNTPPQI